MASDALADVQLQLVKAGDEDMNHADPFANVTEEDVETACGVVRVAVHGDRKRRALFTYHDLGTNYQTCFRGFFAHPEMAALLEYFCVYNINAPGHASESVIFPNRASQNGAGQTYPTLEQLTETIGVVAKRYNVSHFVGLGIGVGANLFCRFQLLHPDMVDALVLVNANVTQAGWVEWSWFKVHNWTFNAADNFKTVNDYLIWHWFGEPSERPHDLVLTYTHALKGMNKDSVGGLVSSFIHRSDANLTRAGKTLKCPSLLITGDSSPHVDEVVETNSRLDPTLNNFLKLADCGGMILDEVPSKVCEALRLFLQGLGYCPALRGSSSQEPVHEADMHTTVPKSYSAATGPI